MVDQVEDATAQVPVPTIEVQQVGQALGTFLAWPIHLVKVFNFLPYCILIIVLLFN